MKTGKMSESKSYKVTIFGCTYTLVSDESEAHILQSAELVDTLMKEIATKSKIADSSKVAVLAALRVASKLISMESTVHTNDNNQKMLIDRIDKEGLFEDSSV